MTQKLAATAIVFDLDGTLVDTLDDITQSLGDALAALGLASCTREQVRGWIGEGAGVLVHRAAAERPDLWPALEDDFRRRYGEALVVRSVLYPGVAELLDGLAARGTPAAVLSNKPDTMTREVVERLLGRWQFASVSGQRAGQPRKPDPAPALAVAAVLGADPERCALVGDTAVDMHTAARAGMVGVGAGWGFRPGELAAAGARVVLKHPVDLLALLDPPGMSGV